jgi:hypothetical protein
MMDEPDKSGTIVGCIARDRGTADFHHTKEDANDADDGNRLITPICTGPSGRGA